ncbi:MAG: DUF6080 domain-containing protein, partial [Tannerellaceae bacterium]|nr:DUF6080 domain-containing protein [Tannerellaceae bacterium]
MEEKRDSRKVIAVFDFDGTIISRDSLRDFLLYTFGRTAFFLRLPLILILKIAALTGIMTTRRAKEHVLSSFMKGMTHTRFQEACRQYALRIPSLVYPKASQEIKNHLMLGHQVLIISASMADWIRPWAETAGISRVEGSEMEIENGLLTGRLSTPNCKGKEKVNRLLALFPDRERYVLYAYGDSPGDQALLAVADYPIYKPAWRKAKQPLFPLIRMEKRLFCLFFLVYGWIGYRMLFLTELIDIQNGGAGSYLGYDNLFHLKTNGGAFDVSHPFFNLFHIVKYGVTKPFTLLFGEKARAVICLLSMNILVSAGLTMLYRYMRRIVGIQAKRAALLTLFTGSFFTTIVLSFTTETYPFSFCFLIASLLILSTEYQQTGRFKEHTVSSLTFLTGGITITNAIKPAIALFLNTAPFRQKMRTAVQTVFPFALCVVAVLGLYTAKSALFHEKETPVEQMLSLNRYFTKEEAFGKQLFTGFWGSAILCAPLERKTIGRETVLRPGEYPHVWQYTAMAFLLALLLVSACLHLNNRYVQLLLLYLGVDMAIHFIARYGMNEAILFGGHWLFAVPILLSWL